MKYQVNLFIPDMGSYKTIAKESHGETVEENALWDINSARRHDGLTELSLDDLKAHTIKGNVKWKPIY